jgi:hypothetical protein
MHGDGRLDQHAMEEQPSVLGSCTFIIAASGFVCTMCEVFFLPIHAACVAPSPGSAEHARSSSRGQAASASYRRSMNSIHY